MTQEQLFNRESFLSERNEDDISPELSEEDFDGEGEQKERRTIPQPEVVKELPYWRVIWTYRLKHPMYNAMLDLGSFLTAISIIIFGFNNQNTVEAHIGKYPKVIFILVVNGMFFLDMIANFIVIGPKKLWYNRKIIYLEVFLQLYSLWIILVTIYSND